VERLLTAGDAIDRIPEGSRIVVSQACGTPTTLVSTLAERCDGRRLSVYAGLLLEHEAVYDAAQRGALEFITWHVTAAFEPLLADRRVSYVPLRASRVPAQLASWSSEVAMVRVTPPDRHGWCSLGPSVGYVRAALDHARLRIAEVDPTLPRTWGDSMVHVSDLDVLVDSAHPMPVYEAAIPNDVSRSIARRVLGLLPDRPVLQLGIGTVPEALVAVFAEDGVDGLRFTGMASEGMVDLAERGLLDRAPRDGLPPISTPDMLGTGTLMRWADENPTVGLYPSTIAHDPVHLGGLDRLVAVNSALEVDLSGQVNSERVRGRQISGIGGSVDFCEGASSSQGGVGVIALPSTTPNGEISRIVPRLGDGSTVTIPGSLVDHVVTEHGVARLAGRTSVERAEALIAIADPRHRDELLAAMR
jgi:4-hydroxybutyrate CoA-transferase